MYLIFNVRKYVLSKGWPGVPKKPRRPNGLFIYSYNSIACGVFLGAVVCVVCKFVLGLIWIFINLNFLYIADIYRWVKRIRCHFLPPWVNSVRLQCGSLIDQTLMPSFRCKLSANYMYRRCWYAQIYKLMNFGRLTDVSFVRRAINVWEMNKVIHIANMSCLLDQPSVLIYAPN